MEGEIPENNRVIAYIAIERENRGIANMMERNCGSDLRFFFPCDAPH
jgi:hypothetical protein